MCARKKYAPTPALPLLQAMSTRCRRGAGVTRADRTTRETLLLSEGVWVALLGQDSGPVTRALASLCDAMHIATRAGWRRERERGGDVLGIRYNLEHDKKNENTMEEWKIKRRVRAAATNGDGGVRSERAINNSQADVDET